MHVLKSSVYECKHRHQRVAVVCIVLLVAIIYIVLLVADLRVYVSVCKALLTYHQSLLTYHVNLQWIFIWPSVSHSIFFLDPCGGHGMSTKQGVHNRCIGLCWHKIGLCWHKIRLLYLVPDSYAGQDFGAKLGSRHRWKGPFWRIMGFFFWIHGQGGTLAPSGGYIIGKAVYVKAARHRLSAPGVDGGATLGKTR